MSDQKKYLHPDVFEMYGGPYVTCVTLDRERSDETDDSGCETRDCSYYRESKQKVAKELEAQAQAEAKAEADASPEKAVEGLSEENPVRAEILALEATTRENAAARSALLTLIGEKNKEFSDLTDAHSALDKRLKQARLDAKQWEADEVVRAQLRKDLDSLATLDYDQVLDTLLRHGVTRLSAPVVNARSVLSEALGTLEASFWIKDAEINDGSEELDLDEDENEISMYFDTPGEVASLGLDKFVAAPFTIDGVRKWGPVTGVCSIGAIALARATLDDETTVMSYTSMAGRDLPTALAGEALARAIRDSTDYSNVDSTDSAGTTIANWNDRANRTREEVLAMFRVARSSSLLDATALWTIRKGAGSRYLAFTFGSEQEAKDFLENVTSATDPMSKYFVMCHVGYIPQGDKAAAKAAAQAAVERFTPAKIL